jgi:beta-lactamase class D
MWSNVVAYVKCKQPLILFFCSLILCASSAFATENFFLAKENNKVLKREGNCSKAYAPESTFKIALSLIGFDSKILRDENNPSWPCQEGYDYYINVCKGDHTPRTWLRDSCAWYSQVLTGKLGMEKFHDYIAKFNYGNKDLSGDKGQNNGLTHAWISSSLQITPDEQTEFLQKIVDQKLPVNKVSFNNTKKIMFIQELPGGWKLYGKTGNGKQLDQNGNKTDLQHGWFVGFIEKGKRKIVFANHLVDSEIQNTFTSFIARNEALIKLWYLIDELKE